MSVEVELRDVNISTRQGYYEYIELADDFIIYATDKDTSGANKDNPIRLDLSDDLVPKLKF